MKFIQILSFLLLFPLTVSPLTVRADSAQIDFAAISKDITKLMQQYHYNPKELHSVAYKKMEQQIHQLAKKSNDKQEFIDSFNKIWQQGPFSHVRLDHARMPAPQMVEYLDTMRVGGQGAMLTWQHSIAILTVNTMMGLDTIEQIDMAYQEITDKGASGLIIDLRNNTGGAFAVKPLVSHLIKQPLDAGIFVSQPWNKSHNRLPTKQEINQQLPWQGWSIKSFWHDAQNNAITRIQFQPTKPYFDKPVYVLVSNKTASAAELAVDAMSHIAQVTIVGETTAGEMLSQKMYDLTHGLQLSLPIADYYTVNSRRIEQNGVTPDVNITAKNAMKFALDQLKQKQ